MELDEFCFWPHENGTRAEIEMGEGEGKETLTLTLFPYPVPLLLSFTRHFFRMVFDPRSSFFVPKPLRRLTYFALNRSIILQFTRL